MNNHWYLNTKLGEECDNEYHCEDCEPLGICETCDTVDGRWIQAVSDYASTCDYCQELTSHCLMEMHEETQLGLCDNCRGKGIPIDVFNK